MEIGPILRSLDRHRARVVLVVLEVALTLAIVTNCVSMILDARAEMSRKSGFDDAHLLSVQSTAFAPEFEQEGYFSAVIDNDLETMRRLPGVRAATSTGFLPWQGGGSSFEVKVDGSEREKVRSQLYGGDTQFLDTLGVQLVGGRNFTSQEVLEVSTDQTQFNVLVSKGLADLLFPQGDALGKVLEDPQEQQAYTIVGVFDPFYNPYGWPIHEYACIFPGRSGGPAITTYLVRTAPGRLGEVQGALEGALLAANGGRNVRVRSILDIRDQFNLGQRVLVASLDGVMFLLVFVTALGIVGLTSFSVSERTRQIGTRRALGATRPAIVRYFLLENWLVTTVGVGLGIALAYALNVGLVTMIEGARLQPAVVAVGVALLWATGLGSALGPALRGARVPPAVATRNV